MRQAAWGRTQASSILETTNRLTCLSVGRIPQNETVLSEKRRLQREELNCIWAVLTLAYPAYVLQEQSQSPEDRPAPDSLAGLIPCLLMETSTRSPVP